MIKYLNKPNEENKKNFYNFLKLFSYLYAEENVKELNSFIKDVANKDLKNIKKKIKRFSRKSNTKRENKWIQTSIIDQSTIPVITKIKKNHNHQKINLMQIDLKLFKNIVMILYCLSLEKLLKTLKVVKIKMI